MKVKYFHDSDTALIEFSSRPIAETKEINENIYIDLDSEGHPVAITIEHANRHANLPNFYYEQIVSQKTQPMLHEEIKPRM